MIGDCLDQLTVSLSVLPELTPFSVKYNKTLLNSACEQHPYQVTPMVPSQMAVTVYLIRNSWSVFYEKLEHNVS